MKTVYRFAGVSTHNEMARNSRSTFPSRCRLVIAVFLFMSIFHKLILTTRPLYPIVMDVVELVDITPSHNFYYKTNYLKVKFCDYIFAVRAMEFFLLLFVILFSSVLFSFRFYSDVVCLHGLRATLTLSISLFIHTVQVQLSSLAQIEMVNIILFRVYHTHTVSHIGYASNHKQRCFSFNQPNIGFFLKTTFDISMRKFTFSSIDSHLCGLCFLRLSLFFDISNIFRAFVSNCAKLPIEQCRNKNNNSEKK